MAAATVCGGGRPAASATTSARRRQDTRWPTRSPSARLQTGHGCRPLPLRCAVGHPSVQDLTTATRGGPGERPKRRSGAVAQGSFRHGRQRRPSAQSRHQRRRSLVVHGVMRGGTTAQRRPERCRAQLLRLRRSRPFKAWGRQLLRQRSSETIDHGGAPPSGASAAGAPAASEPREPCCSRAAINMLCAGSTWARRRCAERLCSRRADRRMSFGSGAPRKRSASRARRGRERCGACHTRSATVAVSSWNVAGASTNWPTYARTGVAFSSMRRAPKDGARRPATTSPAICMSFSSAGAHALGMSTAGPTS